MKKSVLLGILLLVSLQSCTEYKVNIQIYNQSNKTYHHICVKGARKRLVIKNLHPKQHANFDLSMEGVRFDGALFLELDHSNHKRYFFAVYDNGLLPEDKYVLIFKNDGLYTPNYEWHNKKKRYVLRKVFMP